MSHRRSPRFDAISVAFAWAIPVTVLLLALFYQSERLLIIQNHGYQSHAQTHARLWTAWTAPFLSMDIGHAVADAFAWGVAALIARALALLNRAMLAVAWVWPVCNWALMLWPQPVAVVGLSGPVFALLGATVAIATLTPGLRKHAAIGLSYLVIRLTLDAAWTQPTGPSLIWDWQVVHAVHLTGAVAGLAAGLAVEVVSRWLQRS